MRLSILERITLAGILKSKEGNYATLKMLRKAGEVLEIDEGDHRIADIEQEFFCPKCGWLNYFPITSKHTCQICKGEMKMGTKIKWSQDAPEREIELGEIATSIIVGHLKQLDQAGKLTNDLLSLYEKFIEG